MNTINNPYSQALNQVPRLLSLLDRSPTSATYGCFDRSFWHYKTERDFCSAPFQQGTLVLAMLYATPSPENKYHKHPSLIPWIKASLNYWSHIQNRDGSFNEWYPFEHSHVATAFTTYAVTETLLLLRKEITLSIKMQQAIHKAGRWLKQHIDTKVINHTAGAVSALHNIFLLTGDPIFRKAVTHNLNVMLKHQSPEGWFYEYGGADPGYQSVSIDYLAKYYVKSQDEQVQKMLQKGIQFLKHFIHPDGTLGGEYGSRGTKYLMPHGLELIKHEFPEAEFILNKTYEQVPAICNNIETVDDRYLVFFFLPNLIQAWSQRAQSKESAIPTRTKDQDSSSYFPQSGLLVRDTPSYYFVGNLKKGGAFKFFKKNNNGAKSEAVPSAYFTKYSNNKVATSNWLNSQSKIILKKNIFITETNLRYVDQSLPMQKYLIPFRLFNYTFGRLPALSLLLKKCLILKMTKRKKTPITFRRSFTFYPDTVYIEDLFELNNSISIQSIFVEPSTVGLHVPSSNYFNEEDLLSSNQLASSKIETLFKTGHLKIETVCGKT